MSETMRAIAMDRTGGPEVLRLAELARPRPGEGEVLIRVECAAVNPADWKTREGHLARYITYAFPFVPGFDAAGTIEAVGPGVTAWRRGDRVVTCSDQQLGRWGSYAEYVAVAASRVGRMPRNLSFAEAATIPVAGLTAWQALFVTAGLAAGQRLLLNGGAGGVGSYAIQLAKDAGIAVAATCRTENVEYLRGLGADLVIDYTRDDVIAAARAWAPQGVHVVVDAVGCGTLPRTLDALRAGGMLVSIATLVGDGDIAADMQAAAARGLHKVFAVMSTEEVPAQLERLAQLFESGRIRAPALEVLPLADAARAHERVQGGHVRGKLVLQIGAAPR